MPAPNSAALNFLLTRRSRPAKTLTGPVPDDAVLRTILEAAARTPCARAERSVNGAEIDLITIPAKDGRAAHCSGLQGLEILAQRQSDPRA